MTDGPYPGAPQRRRRPNPPADVFPTFDEIAARAYQLYVSDGERVERVFDCWNRAEDELLDAAARRVIR
jgi:hypothetical protein